MTQRTPPALTASRLFKSFGPRPILDDVSLAIDERERVGLIGANGSGKSTLAKVLAGLEPPDGGTVARRRDLSTAYLTQEPELDDTLTAQQEVERGLTRWFAAVKRYEAIGEALSRGDGSVEGLLEEQTKLLHEIEEAGGFDQAHRVRTILEHLGISRPDQPIGQMSGGERRRVALAKILVSRPGLAILDEPTNHLDADTSEWLETHLVEEFGGALLLITHDRYFLDRVVSRVLELDRGNIQAFEGNYARYLDLKAERLEHEARVESNRLNALRKERDWLGRSAPARTSKQKARINRAEDLEQTFRESKRSTDAASFQLSSTKSGKRIVELTGLGKSLGGRVLFRNLDLFLASGDRLGIIGRNGTGKTTLARTILGEIEPTEGQIIMGPSTRTMYFDQQRAGLDDTKTVIDSVAEGADKVRLGDEWISVHSYLDRFLFDGSKQRQVVSSLSGGERARLALARMLQGGANLVILDEPTNDLDLVTLSSLEELLTGFNGCVIAITHDRYFLNRIATSILAFEADGRVVRYAGNYDDYCVQRDYARANAATATAAATPRSDRTSEAPAKKKRAALTFAEERELTEIPERIDAAERNLADLDAALNDPSLYTTRGSEVPALQERRKESQRTLDALMSRWEDLEKKKAGPTT